MTHSEIITLLGSEAESLLNHTCTKIDKNAITVPSTHHVKTVFSKSDRSKKVQESLSRLYSHGNLGDSGYLSIFPVDQGMEHTAAYSFHSNPAFFDPDTIVRFAVEGGCSAVASTAGVLGLVSEQYAREIPFIVKLNHSEHLTLPEQSNQIPFASVQKAHDMGAAGVGATIYFGSDLSHRQIEEIAGAFEAAHRLGMFTILWCYPRNPNYTKGKSDYTQSVDITSQACHIGVTLGADIIKQKLPKATLGFEALKFSKYNQEMYDSLLTEHPIDLVRYQVAHCYSGKVSLINSGGESKGTDDMQEAVKTAVINKRGGGAGLITGRKLFKRPWNEGLEILSAVQSVYLDDQITVA